MQHIATGYDHLAFLLGLLIATADISTNGTLGGANIVFGHFDINATASTDAVSYGYGTRKVSETRGLIRYLMKHQHSTPFEMVVFKFHLKMPIFVMRRFHHGGFLGY